MGYNIFTKLTDGSSVRYTEWVGYHDYTPNWDALVGVELYNHAADPDENTNIVKDPAMANEVHRLSKALRAGWRAL